MYVMWFSFFFNMAENTINEVKREQEIGKVFIIQVIAGHWWLTSVILATC
jgi:hypothetical protein